MNVTFPASLTTEQMTALETALPSRTKLPNIPKKTDVEEVFLEEPNAEQSKKAHDQDGMDEDDEEGGGRPGVQCAQRES